MKKILLSVAALGMAACAGPDHINDDKVFFAFDSAEISDEARESLEDQSLYMKKNPNINVILEGHCDERGSTEYNLALGALRAGNTAHVMIADGIEPERIITCAVLPAHVMIADGIEPERIKTISYGKERPQYPGTGEEVWALNRNSTTKVVDE